MTDLFMQDFSEVFSVTAIDYGRAEPCIIHETDHWAVVYKPPCLPTAPIRAEEQHTLVYWFLQREIAGAVSGAEAVRGKKAIEAGLLHRLDTDTRGLVLFAKTQAVYDFLAARQEEERIVKTYCAFVKLCVPDMAADPQAAQELTAVIGQAVIQEQATVSGQPTVQLPYTLVSQFRNFGPGAKKVAPVFPHSRHYKKEGRLYATVIEAVDFLPPPHAQKPTGRTPRIQANAGTPIIRLRCRLSRGYRHQVRAHLASLGLPIAGDSLYMPQGVEAADNRLQLYAVSIEFPDPENPLRNICVALPPPDKMNR